MPHRPRGAKKAGDGRGFHARSVGRGCSSLSPCCADRLRSSRQWTSWVSGWRHSRIRYSEPGSSTIGIESGEVDQQATTCHAYRSRIRRLRSAGLEVLSWLGRAAVPELWLFTSGA